MLKVYDQTQQGSRETVLQLRGVVEEGGQVFYLDRIGQSGGASATLLSFRVGGGLKLWKLPRDLDFRTDRTGRFIVQHATS